MDINLTENGQQGDIETRVLASVCPPGASAQWKTLPGKPKRLVATFNDGKEESTNEFPRLNDCLKWFCSMQAKKPKSGSADPASSCAKAKCILFGNKSVIFVHVYVYINCSTTEGLKWVTPRG